MSSAVHRIGPREAISGILDDGGGGTQTGGGASGPKTPKTPKSKVSSAKHAND